RELPRPRGKMLRAAEAPAQRATPSFLPNRLWAQQTPWTLDLARLVMSTSLLRHLIRPYPPHPHLFRPPAHAINPLPPPHILPAILPNTEPAPVAAPTQDKDNLTKLPHTAPHMFCIPSLPVRPPPTASSWITLDGWEPKID